MVKAVGVVGGGIMGSGIAEVTARSGCDVVLREVNEAAVEGAQARLQASLDRAVRNGKLPQDERNSIVDRIRFTTSTGVRPTPTCVNGSASLRQIYRATAAASGRGRHSTSESAPTTS